MTTTTDKFTWGEVIWVHEISDIEITEFHPRRPFNVSVEDWQAVGGDDQIAFSITRIEGWTGISRRFNNLDDALIYAIVYKHEANARGRNVAANSRIADYTSRLMRQT